MINKGELVVKMAEKTGLSKKDAEASLNAFMECVEESLKSGEKVQLVGFGTFEAKKRNSRPGRNPKKPETVIMIPEAIAPVFKAGKNLKDALNS